MNAVLGNIHDLPFPNCDTEAGSRFKDYRDHDPLPNIKPALLNAGDIYDYARITGMIWPFVTDNQKLKEKLKPASYEIDFLGTVHYVDEKGEHHKIGINQETPFILRKNSIVFVSLACKFRLPNYIALRFNLRINHVHKGLLLGTGPLVDPGFVGRLLIPLHNLTGTDYMLKGGEGLIWVEFTKLSPRRDKAVIVDFPESKWNLTARQYFNKASPSHGQPAVSSIPGEVKAAKEDAEAAKISAKNSEALIKRFTFWGAIGGGIALITLLATLASVVFITWSFVNETKKDVLDNRREFSEFRIRVLEKLKENDIKNK